MLIIVLRIVHIVTGVFWAGSVFLLVSYLAPTFKAVGPDAGKVFAELRRRKLFERLPMVAGLTIISGFWMFALMSQNGDWARGPEALVLGVGAIAAIIGLLIGVFVMRANTLKAADLMQTVGPMPAGADKDAKMAQVQAMRGKATMGGRLTATLLLIAVIAMAIARYVV